MIGYVCKYTPVELLTALGAEPVLLEPKVSNFNRADACMHPNVCCFAKAVLESLADRDCEGLVLTSCCDSIRRLADVYRALYPDKFLYVLGLPRNADEGACALFAKDVLGLMKGYAARFGGRFNRGCLVDLLMAQRLRARRGAVAQIPGPPRLPRVGIVGARYGADISRQLQDNGLEVAFDLSCAKLERDIGARVEPTLLDDGQTSDEQLVRAYSEALLCQMPCVRMGDVSERDAFLASQMGHLDGLVYHTVKFCDIYSFEYAYLLNQAKVPILKIETDATNQSAEQVRTRIEAFAESLGGGKETSMRSGEAVPRTEGTRYVLGIDSGSTSTNAVILDADRNLVAHHVVRTGARASDSARRALEEALAKAGLERDDLSLVVATGYGRSTIDFADTAVTEISCHGKGARFFDPSVRTILDIGGQDSKAIRLDGEGNVVEFVMNDKCAAGTGRFLEAMARTLECDISELGPLSFESRSEVEISSMCTVFAESEVIGLIANDADRADIARGVSVAIAGKAMSLLRRVGPEPGYMMTGGVARNPGVVRAVEELLGSRLYICEEPDIVGAVGSAVFGLESLLGTSVT